MIKHCEGKEQTIWGKTNSVESRVQDEGHSAEI